MGLLEKGRQTTVELSTTAIFSVFGGYCFGNFRDKLASVIIIMAICIFCRRVIYCRMNGLE